MKEQEIKSTFKVGKFMCTLTVTQSGSMDCEWFPNAPKKLSEKELAEYRRGRDMVIGELSKLIGGSIAVVEI